MSSSWASAGVSSLCSQKGLPLLQTVEKASADSVSSRPGHKHKENVKSHSLVIGSGDGTAAGGARVSPACGTKAAHKEDVQSQRAGLQPSLEHTVEVSFGPKEQKKAPRLLFSGFWASLRQAG